uniref:Uncharacterized protein n=1 Tax=viral metagenome TaxID=1070528 RepID=A0A6C0IJN4_9ZZZZ
MNSAIGTTSIDSLPTTQMQGPPQENIRLDIDNSVAKLQQSRDAELQQAQQGQGQAQQGQGVMQNAMSQQNMNQFVSGLQQASASGLTTLPSRDIPQTQSHLTQDQQMQPNYVPQERHNTDYITEQQSNEEIIRKHGQREQQVNSLDNFYNNLQTPILIAILYFLFQLPVVRKNVFKFAPALFSKDGNPNLMGYVINSAIFAGLYFSMTKGIHYFSI